MKKAASHILWIIIFSQFAGTSVWFAGNAVLPDLMERFGYDDHAIRNITTAVMIGFIAGTLVFALLSIADRYKPSVIFFVSCCIAALANVLILISNSYATVLLLRFVTGFFLAGIYPVGMKIAADYYEKGLGKALGYLVGALVFGTAFPHLLKGLSLQLPWRSVLIFTSSFAFAGGLAVLLLIPAGPYRQASQKFSIQHIFSSFRSNDFRAAALGYFGHMWELYTFWAFLPFIIQWQTVLGSGNIKNISLVTFATIAIGGVSCMVGGIISQKTGSKKVAAMALGISSICCIVFYPMMHASALAFIIFLMIWEIAVTADSPQFSALVASSTMPDQKGTALTMVTSIGFAITVVSMYVFDYLLTHSSPYLFSGVLAAGPILGLIAILQHGRNN